MSFEYRLIPAPRSAKRAKGARTLADRYARTLTDLVNDFAAEGWEYIRADTLPVDEKKGMLSSATESFQTVLVFRKETRSARGLEPVERDVEPPITALSLGPAKRRR